MFAGKDLALLALYIIDALNLKQQMFPKITINYENKDLKILVIIEFLP